MHTNLEIMKLIKNTVEETLTSIGFTMEDRKEMQQDLIFIRKKRKNQEYMWLNLKKGIVTALIPTVLYSVWNYINYGFRL